MSMNSEPSANGAYDAPPVHLDFDVEGMTCASCVRRVENALRAVPGVEAADVNFALERASVVASASIERIALVEAVRDAGYEVRERPDAARTAATSATSTAPTTESTIDSERIARRRELLIAVALGAPVIALGMSHGAIPSSMSHAARVVALVLSTIVVFGPGSRFLRLAWNAARHRTTDMNSLVAVGVLAAYGYSAAAVLLPEAFSTAHHAAPHVYFEAAVAIVLFVLLGKLLETRARSGLAEAVRGLVSLKPDRAQRVRQGVEESVATDSLVVGDEIIVRPGERIAADGAVVWGNSNVDESMLTGESAAVAKSTGDSVVAGTTNLDGSFRFRVEGVGGNTALARIVKAVERAQGSRAPIARLADVVSARFVPIVFALATITFGAHFMIDSSSAGLATALEHFVAVLVIACPCALGLATPAAIAVGTGRGAGLGVLVRGGESLETASRVDTVFFDKTGTLTRGEPTLMKVEATGSFSEDALLALVASVEHGSEHSLARAIRSAATSRGVRVDEVSEFRADAGQGISARIAGRLVRVGRREFVDPGFVDGSEVDLAARGREDRGETTAFVSVDGSLAGFLAIADAPREEAASTIRTLRDLGIDVAMVTGDRVTTANSIARELGIERVHAEVRPEDKARIVMEERGKGRTVAFVGDGINDAPALASADLGIAVTSATDIAGAAADVVLVRRGLDSVATAIRLARATLRTIRQNLFWAFVYNVIGIPIAAGIFEPVGIGLSPAIASAAMSLSSVSVIWNSMRLRRFDEAADGE